MTNYQSAIPAHPLVLVHEEARSHAKALLIIDGEHDVTVTTRTYYGSDNAVPESEWHNRHLVFTLASASRGSCAVDLDRLREDLDEGGDLAVLIDRIIAGHSIEWNGSNHVGRLTDDAGEASLELEQLVDYDRYVSDTSVWDAANWVWGDNSAAFALDALGLTVDATDADIERAAAEVRIGAATDGVILTGDVEEAVREVVERVREETRDEEE